jgi:hypothetical protein
MGYLSRLVGFNKPEIAHQANARPPHNNTCDKFVTGDPKNRIPIKYVAAQPDPTPVSTIYPHVSAKGGHRDDNIHKTPASMNILPQN